MLNYARITDLSLPSVIAVVTFGDPSHVTGTEWDDGTSKNEGVSNPRRETLGAPSSDIDSLCVSVHLDLPSSKHHGVRALFRSHCRMVRHGRCVLRWRQR